MKLILIACSMFIGTAFAQEGIVEPSIPMLKEILAFLGSIPAVGPYVKIGLEIMASIAVFCTAASGFLKAVLSISQIAASKFAPKFAEKIRLFEEKILPWFKYLSMMNTSKDEMKKAHIPKQMM